MWVNKPITWIHKKQPCFISSVGHMESPKNPNTISNFTLSAVPPAVHHEPSVWQAYVLQASHVEPAKMPMARLVTNASQKDGLYIWNRSRIPSPKTNSSPLKKALPKGLKVLSQTSLAQ